jgi:hypothetical protein
LENEIDTSWRCLFDPSFTCVEPIVLSFGRGWSERDLLALQSGSTNTGVAHCSQPLDGCQMLGFEPASTSTFATDICDVDWLLGETGEANGDAQELASAFQGRSFQMDG